MKARLPTYYIKDLYPDTDRIIESVLYLMKKGRNLSQYQIVKAIFFADRKHLNEYGRPVTFDNYTAMRQGPVPTLVYDLLKPGPTFERIFGGKNRPWVSTPEKGYHRFAARRDPLPDVLSQTDLAALDYGLDTVRTLSQFDLEKKLHDDPAYKEAWGRRGIKNSVDMKTYKLLDNENEEIIENLAFATRH